MIEIKGVEEERRGRSAGMECVSGRRPGGQKRTRAGADSPSVRRSGDGREPKPFAFTGREISDSDQVGSTKKLIWYLPIRATHH